MSVHSGRRLTDLAAHWHLVQVGHPHLHWLRLSIMADEHPSRFPGGSTSFSRMNILGSVRSSSPHLVGHGTIDGAS